MERIVIERSVSESVLDPNISLSSCFSKHPQRTLFLPSKSHSRTHIEISDKFMVLYIKIIAICKVDRMPICASYPAVQS